MLFYWRSLRVRLFVKILKFINFIMFLVFIVFVVIALAPNEWASKPDLPTARCNAIALCRHSLLWITG